MSTASLTSPTSESHHDRLLGLARSFAEGFRWLGEAASGGSDVVAGVYCWHSSSYIPAFNSAALVSAADFEPGALSEVEAYFGARGRPYCVVALDGLVPDSGKKLHDLGYSEYDSSPAMWLRGMPNRLHDAPSRFRVAPIGSLAQLVEFRTLVSRVFHIAPSEVDLVFGQGVLGVGQMAHYLGWVGGEPVATASMVFASGHATIWNVGTLPHFRRRGLAAAMMHRIVADALDKGYTSTALLASTQGLPMYERLGYVAQGSLRMFMPSDPARRYALEY